METVSVFFRVLVLLYVFGIGKGSFIKYNNDARVVERKLNVHLVPRSHDDVGWLITIDQYNVGSNNSIQ
ncbi:hypothetical protein MKX01_022721, partial [Papaver californicum]